MANAKTQQRLVIVESPAKAKTISGLPRPGVRGRGQLRPRPRPAPQRRRRAGQVQGRGVGPPRRGRRQRLRRALRGHPRPHQAGRPGSRRCSRTPTNSSSPRTRTARARPSPGTWSRRSSPRCRSSGWSSTRSPGRRSSGGGQPARDRPGAGRRPGGAAHPRPALRLRGLPGAVEEGHAEARRPAGCSPSPPGSWSSASASGWRSAPPSTGTSGPPSRSPPTRSRTGRAPSPPPWSRSTATGSPPARTSTRPPARSGPAPAWSTSTSDGARGLAARLEGRPFEVTRVEEKPYRRRPYAPFITSTLQQEAGPQAAATRPRRRCAPRSGSTRTATSPICVPTR